MGETPVMVCEHALADVKAEDVTHIDLTNRGAYTDHILIATGTSDRHIQSLADRVDEYLSKAGYPVLSVEGSTGSPWVIVDAGDLVVHIFTKDARNMYNLEKMYSHDFNEAPAI